MKKIAIATCAEVPALDEDGELLLGALASAGLEGVPCVWNDPHVAWGDYPLVVVRSTWDYAAQLDDYLAWARRVESVSTLANPAEVIAWNTDKRYLRALETAGVPVARTYWPAPGEPLPALDDFVVKPAISAGCIDTARFRAGAEVEAQALADEIHASGRAVMVQPYMASVDAHGESALLYFAGQYSHAIRKGGMLVHDQGLEEGLFRQEDIRSREASEGERAAARAVLDAMPFDAAGLLYVRVDLVQDHKGQPVVLELELTEPSIFLLYSEGAAARFAQAVAGHPALA